MLTAERSAVVYTLAFLLMEKNSIWDMVGRGRGFGGPKKKISIFYPFPRINTHFVSAYVAVLLGAENQKEGAEQRSGEESKRHLGGRDPSSATSISAEESTAQHRRKTDDYCNH